MTKNETGPANEPAPESPEERGSIKTGVTRRIIGFVLIALGILNSLFKVKAGIDETSWLNLILIGAGGVIFFSGRRRGRGL